MDSLTLAVLFFLILFGVAYNYFVQWSQARGYAEGFTSLLVAGGVLVTLCGVAIISVNAAFLTLASFSASGAPMVAGSLWRYIKRREQAQKAMQHDNPPRTR